MQRPTWRWSRPLARDASFKVTVQGGMMEVLQARGADGKKLSDGEFALNARLIAGVILGD